MYLTLCTTNLTPTFFLPTDRQAADPAGSYSADPVREKFSNGADRHLEGGRIGEGPIPQKSAF